MPRSLAPIMGAFRAPEGVAADGAVLAVVDSANHRLALHDLAGSSAPIHLGRPGTSPGQEGLLQPTAAVFDGPDRLYVADTGNRHLDRYDRTAGVWAWHSAIALQGLAAPLPRILDAKLDPAGGLLLLDGDGGRLLHYDPTQGTTKELLKDPDWIAPVALAATPHELLVADAGAHRVWRYDAAYHRTSLGGFGTAPGRLREPRGVAVDGNGVILVADAGNARLQGFAASGAHLHSTPMPVGSRADLRRVAVVADRAYVADAGADLVRVIDLAASSSTPRIPSDVGFGAVGVGLTLPQGVSIENPGPTPLRIEDVVVRGAEFAVDPSSPTPPFQIPAGGRGAIAIRYRPAREGPAFGLVRIETDSIDAPTAVVSLSGEGLEVDPISLALVLDRSGSMMQSSGPMRKIERMQAACELLLDLLAPGQGASQDELAIVPFSTQASVALPRAPLSHSGTTTARNVIRGLSPSGMTSIGSGLQAAASELAGAPTRRSIIVLSDGVENTAPRIEDVALPPGIDVYSVGLGLPQYLDVAKLQAVSNRHGGYFQVTDGDDLQLSKFFVQIFSDVSGQPFAVDPPLRFTPESVHHVDVDVGECDEELVVTLAWESPKATFDVALVTPAGAVVPSWAFRHVATGPRHVVARLGLAGTRWGAPGRWRVRLTPTRLPGPQERAFASVLVRSRHQMEVAFQAYEEATRAKGREAPSPATSTPALDPPSVLPAKGLVTGIPTLRPGSRLRVTARPVAAAPDLRLVAGGLELRSPAESLVEAMARTKGRDLDMGPDAPDRPGPRGRTTRYPLRRSKEGGLTFEGPLQGPDGVHSGVLRVKGVTAGGHPIVRERAVQVLLTP